MSYSYFNKRAIIPLILALVAAASLYAAPNDATAFMDSIVGLDEVSVSAIKSTSAGRIPAAQTDINRSQIVRYDITGLRGASEIAPNFYMPQYGSRMTSSIYVRGLGTRIDQPVVAMNVDNVQILNKDNFDFNFPDMENVEIVRGAQSILYGRNSMGGVINISTISPLRFQGTRLLMQYGSGNTWRFNASHYCRLDSDFGVGIIASMNATDGFFRNALTGRKVDKERQGFFKIKTSWRPLDRIILENSAWVALLRQGGYPYEYVETGQIAHNDTCFYRRTTVVDGLTARWFGDNLSVASITGFQYHNDNMTLDQDFLPEDYFVMSQRRHEWSLTQDLVVKGSRGAYNWLAGAFGFYRRYNMAAPVTFKDYGITHLIEDNINSKLPQGMQLIWDDRDMLLQSDFRSPTWGYALYTKHECNAGPLTASLGLRLAFERTSLRYHSHVQTSATMHRLVGPNKIPLMSMPIETTLRGNPHMTSLQLLPEIKIGYSFGDHLTLSALLSKGSKSGGYNTQMFSDILKQEMERNAKPSMPGGRADNPAGNPDAGQTTQLATADIISYKPETSWNYEINLAGNYPDANLHFELSAFWIDCRNQQMTIFPDETGTGRMMTNAGRTRSLGVELTANWQPLQPLTLVATYGLADARFRDFDDGKLQYRGNHVPYAPENTLFLSASWRIDITGDRFFRSIEPTATCRGVGRVYWNEANDLSQPFYTMLGASLTARTRWFDLDIWAENITDTRYSTFYFESVGHRFLQRGNPRRLGATLRLTL